jgi:GH15 family glucan-1,4-alpha-glucosidase
MNNDLYHQSVQIILDNQSPAGAYIACPNFPSYRYCWLRDGSFISHAMDMAGEHRSARKFHLWVGEVIRRYAYKVDRLEKDLAEGHGVSDHNFLHTRFTLEGVEASEDQTWGNFQIDGYGTWLWALLDHIRMSGDPELLRELSDAVRITLRYLRLTWLLPNYDCWEEHPEYLHSYTLGAIHAGFTAAVEMVEAGLLDEEIESLEHIAGAVRNFLLKYGAYAGRIVKHIQPITQDRETTPVITSGVDASLIALVTPYHLFSPDEPLFSETLKYIEKELRCPGGGIYRFKNDTYYGAGEWLLLTAWLGWYYVQSGKLSAAQNLLTWIEQQADGDSNLPEQVSGHVLAPDYYDPWVRKWGPIASPLLWSHAMYIILARAIQEAK